MSVDVDSLLQTARREDEEGQEALLQLMFLIERARYPAGADLRVQIGDGHAEYKLSDAELRAAIDGLLGHLRLMGEDTPGGVLRALAKSGDARVLAPVVDLLTRLIGRADREQLASLALQTVIACSRREDLDVLRSALHAAAERGTGDVAELARDWLDIPE